MFKINLNGAEPQWYPWPENAPEKEQARLKIRPYPSSRGKLVMRRTEGEGKEVSMEIVKPATDNKEIFMYSLMEVENLTDSEGTLLDLKQEVTVIIDSYKKKMSVKEFIFEYQFATGLPTFVITKASAVAEEIKEEEKN